MKTKFKHIVITGASSGIGEALALHYAPEGLRLSLTGRNQDRLEAVAQVCRDKGATVQTALTDVTDGPALQKWMADIDREIPVDLVIANAGISGGTAGVMSGEDPAQVRRIFDVNVNGVFNTVDAVLPAMTGRRRGQIALMASLAGFRGWPGAPAYCASKAAVRTYGEGLRGALADTGVKINVICPGFVVSRMTDANDYPMPFIMSAERAARIIARGLEKNHGRIAFPFPALFLAWFFSAIPDGMAQLVLKHTPAKGAVD